MADWTPGTIVRFGPNRLSVNSTSGLRAIYGTKCNTRKSSYYKVFAHVFKGESTNTIADPVKHGRKKRVLTQALSDSSIRAMEPQILKNVRIFCDCLGQGYDSGDDKEQSSGKEISEGWSSPKNVTRWAGCLTFDIMGDICFSQSFDMLTREDNRYVLDTLPPGVQALNLVCANGQKQLESLDKLIQ